MTPKEVLDLELWEVNAFLLGCKERVLLEQENLIRLSHTIASMNNSKKLKPLSYYLEKVRGNQRVKQSKGERDEIERKMQKAFLNKGE